MTIRIAMLIVVCAMWGVVVWAQPNEIAYQIEAVLDPATKTVTGQQTIQLTNLSGERLNELYLYLYPNRFQPHSVYAHLMGMDDFDDWFPFGPEWGYLNVESLTLNGEPLAFSIDDIIMHTQLPQALDPQMQIELELKFQLKIPRSVERLGYSGTNFFLSWWYPQLAVFDEGGWHTERMVGYWAAEPYQDFARYDVALNVPQDFVVAATGNLTSETANGDGTKTLRYQAEQVHDFAWVADPQYQTQVLDCDGIEVTSLYWAEHAERGRSAAGFSCDALRYFGERFGSYPYKRFTVAEAGMRGIAVEYPQLVMNTHTLYQYPKYSTILDSVNAHEVAHQWFYGMLANDQTAETWLDEGFARYSQAAYLEHKYGKEDNAFDMADTPIWLAEPIKVMISQIFGQQRQIRDQLFEAYISTARRGQTVPLLTHSGQIPPGKANHPYEKGALLLFALENELGVELFNRVMQTYFETFKFQQITSEDFIAVSESVSERSLDWFFDAWLRTTQNVDYVLERIEQQPLGDGVLNRIVIRNDGSMHMPVDVDLIIPGASQPLRQRWDNRERFGVLTVFSETPVQNAIIDPEGVLPDLQRANNRLQPLFSVTPVLDHGMLYGRAEDGFVVGADVMLRPLNAQGTLSYLLGRQRLRFEGTLEHLFSFADQRTSRLSLSVLDDSRVRSVQADVDFNWFSTLTPTSSGNHTMTATLYFDDRYDVLEAPGTEQGLGLGYELDWADRRGQRGQLKLEHRQSLPGSTFAFNKHLAEVHINQRLSWETSLNTRAFFGWKDGNQAIDDDFTLQQHGLFRTFERHTSQLFAVNVDVRLPVPGLNFVPLALPLSFGMIFFADSALLLDEQMAQRTEAGVGITGGTLGQRDWMRLELPLWFSTQEDDPKREVTLRFSVHF